MLVVDVGLDGVSVFAGGFLSSCSKVRRMRNANLTMDDRNKNVLLHFLIILYTVPTVFPLLSFAWY